MSARARRLVVVSNRVALPEEARAGGLAIALRAALEEKGGVWFGWSGDKDPVTPGAVHHRTANNIQYVTLDLSAQDIADYYDGFANRTLWPLLHFRVDLADYSRETYAGYRRVNALFADHLAPLLNDSDIVWVHDYHLIPMAQLLRERGVRCRLGFFLHVPMPSSDLLAALPDHERVFEGLSAYDLIGFQTERDLERFQDYVRLFGRGRVLGHGVLETERGRQLQAGAFPISIDTAGIARQASVAAATRPSVKRLASSLAGRALAIGVDRLDYSKGLPERLRAWQHFLDRYPDDRGRMTFLQVAPISRGEVREYRILRHQLEQLAGHINGSYADADWMPVRYVNRDYPHATLTGFYRLARVALVTPLRDGMNLVAKEFVASQDPADPGVLILSQFAGAARELPGALLVNPYDVDGVADAVAQALHMSRDERIARWQPMMAHLEVHDISAWRREFLEQLRGE